MLKIWVMDSMRSLVRYSRLQKLETVLMTSKLNQLQSMPSLPMKQVLGCLLVNTT